MDLGAQKKLLKTEEERNDLYMHMCTHKWWTGTHCPWSQERLVL